MAKKKATNEHGNGHAEGLFKPGELMTLAELKRRVGWADGATREMKRRGLRVVKIGSTRFVWADDLIEFVREHATEETI